MRGGQPWFPCEEDKWLLTTGMKTAWEMLAGREPAPRVVFSPQGRQSKTGAALCQASAQPLAQPTLQCSAEVSHRNLSPCGTHTRNIHTQLQGLWGCRYWSI